jgi:Flp pilus assembly protein TadG
MLGLCMLSIFKKYRKREDGSTAIEFSMLALPYIMLSLAIIELSLLYASASLLESATDSASRMVRTGQIQQSGSSDPEQMFRDALCQFAVVLIDCNDVQIEVMPLASYNDYTPPTYDEDGNMLSSGFDAGGSDDRILIRVAYRYEMITPLVGPLLNGPDGSSMFISTIVLQTEPYDFEDGAS